MSTPGRGPAPTDQQGTTRRGREMSREDAIAHLHACHDCGRWITTPDCDSCFVDRLPPRVTPEAAIDALNRAIRLGLEAEKLRAHLRGLLK